MAQKTKVALVFGGRSAEHNVSLISASSIFQNLDKQKYDPVCIYINKQGFWRAVESPMLSRSELENGPFLIFLPWGNTKSSSPIAADFTQQDVRRIGLANGLVDYKVCSIDESWSGLLFTPKKAERG